MLTITEIKVDGYRRVARGENPKTGLDAIIAVHDTTLGIALGGCRFMPYDSYEKHLQDALNLSKGMSYKNAMAGLSLGGGKTAINAYGPFTEELAESFAEFINEFNKDEQIYVTAGDVGTGITECEMIAKYTPHIQGVEGVTDSGWATAYGVFMAMGAALEHRNKRFENTHVAVNGLGKVGSRLVQFLHGVGAKISVSDIRPEIVEQHVQEYGCKAVPVDAIHKTPCDVYSPCAVGGAINIDTIDELNCLIICGGANNQLANDYMGQRLKDRDITYVPDFVANSGGVIIVSTLRGRLMDLDYYNPLVIGKLNTIAVTVKDILRSSGMDNITPDKCAERLAISKLSG